MKLSIRTHAMIIGLLVLLASMTFASRFAIVQRKFSTTPDLIALESMNHVELVAYNISLTYVFSYTLDNLLKEPSCQGGFETTIGRPLAISDYYALAPEQFIILVPVEYGQNWLKDSSCGRFLSTFTTDREVSPIITKTGMQASCFTQQSINIFTLNPGATPQCPLKVDDTCQRDQFCQYPGYTGCIGGFCRVLSESRDVNYIIPAVTKRQVFFNAHPIISLKCSLPSLDAVIAFGDIEQGVLLQVRAPNDAVWQQSECAAAFRSLFGQLYEATHVDSSCFGYSGNKRITIPGAHPSCKAIRGESCHKSTFCSSGLICTTIGTPLDPSYAECQKIPPSSLLVTPVVFKFNGSTQPGSYRPVLLRALENQLRKGYGTCQISTVTVSPADPLAINVRFYINDFSTNGCSVEVLKYIQDKVTSEVMPDTAFFVGYPHIEAPISLPNQCYNPQNDSLHCIATDTSCGILCPTGTRCMENKHCGAGTCYNYYCR
jgi:hypothetical protein